MNLLVKGVLGLLLFFVIFNVARNLFYDVYASYWYQASRENSNGKRVLITGSSRGIGEALALVYAGLGAHVTVHASSLDALKKVKTKCKERGASSVLAVAGDLTTVGRASEVVEKAAEQMGGLDIVVINHISPTEFAPLPTAAPDSAQGQLRAMQVNFFSYVEAARAALPYLEKSHGSIVLVSSAAARLPIPYCYEYCFSKRALEGFFSALRQELALNGSSVHAGLAVLGSIGTDMARRTLPKYYKSEIPFASTLDTARDIAAIPVGRLRELASPWTVRVPLLLSSWAPEHIEKHLQALSKVL